MRTLQLALTLILVRLVLAAAPILLSDRLRAEKAMIKAYVAEAAAAEDKII